MSTLFFSFILKLLKIEVPEDFASGFLKNFLAILFSVILMLYVIWRLTVWIKFRKVLINLENSNLASITNSQGPNYLPQNIQPAGTISNSSHTLMPYQPQKSSNTLYTNLDSARSHHCSSLDNLHHVTIDEIESTVDTSTNQINSHYPQTSNYNNQVHEYQYINFMHQNTRSNRTEYELVNSKLIDTSKYPH